MWLLLIEDEERLAASLKAGLEEEGYLVDVAQDGDRGELLARDNAYDALIVDWRLPGRDGKTIVERLRAAGKVFPILMLTALADLEHRVAGLNAGADDYLAKPFSFDELLARLRALTRRSTRAPEIRTLGLGSLTLNPLSRVVTVEAEVLDLRPKEFALLEDLLRHSGEIIPRSTLAVRVWGGLSYVTDNVLDVTVSGLRHKLNDVRRRLPHASVPSIETVRGIGYRLTVR